MTTQTHRQPNEYKLWMSKTKKSRSRRTHGARAILQISKFDVDTFAIMAKEAVLLVGEVCTLARQPATRQHTTERS